MPSEPVLEMSSFTSGCKGIVCICLLVSVANRELPWTIPEHMQKISSQYTSSPALRTLMKPKDIFFFGVTIHLSKMLLYIHLQ